MADIDDELAEAMAFKLYMEKVDKELYKVCGMSSQDIADGDWYSHFDSGASPAVAAMHVLHDTNDVSMEMLELLGFPTEEL